MYVPDTKPLRWTSDFCLFQRLSAITACFLGSSLVAILTYISLRQEHIRFVEQKNAPPSVGQLEVLAHVLFDIIREIADVTLDG